MADEDEATLVRRLYHAALLRDPEEWHDYLAEACADDPRVRSRVLALLDARSLNLSGLVSDTPSSNSTPPPSNVEPAVENRTIGPYLIRREIGRGGMGVVYLADDTRLSRRVALKAISPSIGRDLSGRERLRLEARAAAGLSHPGIATVYALEEIEDGLYLACEYVPGEPLRTLLKSGPLPLEQVVDIAMQLARALAAAHTNGIVHRDIKPENIMRTPSGVVKVLDFGLARMEDQAVSARLTQTGTILGTPAYLSPEQAQGQSADFRTDIFALGLLTYELAAGLNPFATAGLTATIARIIEEEPPPLSDLQPQHRTDLDEIVSRCLRKDPRQRYQSTQEVVIDLERLQADLQEARRQMPMRTSGAGHLPRATARSRPGWWWEVHQIVVSVIYVVMVYPAWYVRPFVPPPWGMLFVLGVLASVAAATSLRLHLWFLARHFPSEVSAQQAISQRRIRLCDLAFGLLLTLSAIVIASNHPEFAMLFIAVAAATLVAAFVIEPVTARVAFGGGSK